MGEACDLPLRTASKRVGLTALAKGVDAAHAEYEEVRKNRPAQYDVRGAEREIDGYAGNYVRLRRMSSAETLYQLNARLFPDSPDAWNSLGRFYALLGKEELSKNALARSEDITKLEDDLYALLAEKKYKDAEEKIKSVRQNSPGRAIFTPSRIGPLFGEAFDSQMHEEALSICRLWILGNPQAAGPYFSMARAHIKMGNKEEAAACYRKIIEMFPGQFAEAAKKELEKLFQKKIDE